MWRFLLLVLVTLLAMSLALLLPAGFNLEYEYALYAIYLCLVLIPLTAIFLPQRLLPAPPNILAEFFWTLGFGPLIAFLPAVLWFWLGACPCSRTGFSFWMVFLWYPGWILAHAAYYAIIRSRSAGRGRLQLSLGFIAVLLVVLAYVGSSLWFNPQKRIISFVAGFLHGPIYDDLIVLDQGLMLARASHLLLALSLLFLAWTQRQVAMIITVIILGSGFIVTAVFADRYPSIQSGKHSLDEFMPATLSGAGFTMHYKPNKPANGSYDQAVPLRLKRLQRDTNFHMRELTSLLSGSHGDTKLPHVHIYVYPDSDTKKLWFGGGSTDVTDVYTPSIHITADGWPHPTLRHELVHALASDLAFHGLGFHPNMAFTEGLAMALAPSPQALTMHEGAAALLATHKVKDVKNLFSPAFWRVSGQRAYTVAGSLIQFLLEKHGIESVLALYQGGSWQNATGHTEGAVLDAWREFLKPLYNHEREAVFAEALYRYPGILNDRCPHSKADLQRDDSLFFRLRQPLGWSADDDYLPWLQKLDPDDLDIRLQSWRREIKALVQDRFTPPEKLVAWKTKLRDLRKDPPKALEDVEMALLESDLARVLNDQTSSLNTLTMLSEHSKKNYFGESLSREIEARIYIEQNLSSDPRLQALEWRKFLAGWRRHSPDMAPNIMQNQWLISYLRLRHARTTGLKLERDELLQLLNRMPDIRLSNSFHVEWYKILALRLMQAEAYIDAAKAYRLAASVAPSGQRDSLAEHARRADFYAANGPLHLSL